MSARDESSEAAQWLFVDEQLQDEFPECVRGRVLPAPQRHLRLGLQQSPCAREMPLTVVGVQQPGRRPATDSKRPRARS
jgi:hypothetical protein